MLCNANSKIASQPQLRRRKCHGLLRPVFRSRRGDQKVADQTAHSAQLPSPSVISTQTKEAVAPSGFSLCFGAIVTSPSQEQQQTYHHHGHVEEEQERGRRYLLDDIVHSCLVVVSPQVVQAFETESQAET